MITRDLYNRLSAARAISPTRVADNTAQVSQIIDMSDAMGLLFVIALGTLADADATFTALVEHGDDSGLSDAAAPSADELNGTIAGASFTFAADNTVRLIGYAGVKRYVRLTITPAGNSGDADLAVVAIKSPRITGYAG